MDIGKIIKYSIMSVATALISYMIVRVIREVMAGAPITSPIPAPSPAPQPIQTTEVKISSNTKSVIGNICVNIEVCQEGVCKQNTYSYTYKVMKDGSLYKSGTGRGSKLCFAADKPGIYRVIVYVGSIPSNTLDIYVFNPDRVKLEVLCGDKYTTYCKLVGNNIAKFKVSVLADNKEYAPSSQYTVKVERPDNTTKVLTKTGNTFSLQLTNKGTYVIKVEYAGYESNPVTISFGGGTTPPYPGPGPIQIQGVIKE